MTDIERLEHMPFASYEPRPAGETYYDWLVEDVGARFRVRAALEGLNIEQSAPQAPPEGLLYSVNSFVDMGVICGEFDMPFDPESRQGQTWGVALLNGTLELRKDWERYPDNVAAPDLRIFSQLPAELQMFSAFKVIDFLYPGVLSEETREERLESYLTDRLGVSEAVKDDILKCSALIGADKILTRMVHPRYADSTNTTGVPLDVLAGPENPHAGIHAGVDLEKAVSDMFNYYLGSKGYVLQYMKDGKGPDYWGEEDYQKVEEFWDVVETILGKATDQLESSSLEPDRLRGYLFAKACEAFCFKPRKMNGYHVGLDQLVGYYAPIEDKEYEDRLKSFRAWLDHAAYHGFEGLDLARHSLAVRIIDDVEYEVVHNSSEQPRSTRIRTVAILVRDLLEQSPELAESVLSHCPLLRSAIEREVDPWAQRFNTTIR